MSEEIKPECTRAMQGQFVEVPGEIWCFLCRKYHTVRVKIHAHVSAVKNRETKKGWAKS